VSPRGENYTLAVSKRGCRTTSFTVSVGEGETVRRDFAVSSRYLELLYPNGGESIFAGSEVAVRWESAGIEEVRIEFSPDGGRTWFPLVGGVDARSGRYIWEVDDIPSPEYRIRISDTGGSGLSDVSDGTFSNSSI